jgi:CrcB protein
MGQDVQRGMDLESSVAIAKSSLPAFWHSRARNSPGKLGQMTKWLLIALGGAAGSCLRYAMQGAVQRWAGGPFPAGTLAVNVVGCALIGFLAAAFAGPWTVREDLRLALVIGGLGGFTTFSAFGWETFALGRDGEMRLALSYVAASCALGLAAVGLGFRLGQRLLGA